jgi:hypothetical protein
MNFVNCFKRPSSKARQSLKKATLIHNVVSVDEEKVNDGNIRNDRGG